MSRYDPAQIQPPHHWKHSREYGVRGPNITVEGRPADVIPTPTREQAVAMADMLIEHGHDYAEAMYRFVSTNGQATIRSDWCLTYRTPEERTQS